MTIGRFSLFKRHVWIDISYWREESMWAMNFRRDARPFFPGPVLGIHMGRFLFVVAVG